MKQEQRLLMNEGLMVLGFAYAIDGYHVPALIAGVIGLMTAWKDHEEQGRKYAYPILCVSFMELIIIRFTSLNSIAPAAGILTVLNTAVCFLWMDSPFAVMDRIMKVMMTVMLVMYIITMIIPSMDIGFIDAIVYISLIFLPMTFSYILRCMKDASRSHYMESDAVMR